MVLGLSVVPLGGNRVFVSAAASLALVTLFFVQFIAMVLTSAQPLRRLSAGWPVVVSLALYGCWVWLQTSAFTGVPLSADVHSTRMQLLATAGYLAAFCLVVLQVQGGSEVRHFVKALVFLGVAQALLAIYLYSGQVEYELFHFPVDHANRTMGTFSYHNSLANYLVICLCLGVGLLVSGLGDAASHERNWRSRVVSALNMAFSEVVRLRVMLLVMVVALVLTKSRMGNAAFMLALLLVAVPVLAMKGHLRLKGMLLVLSIIVLDVFFVGQLVGFDEVAKRMNKTAIEAVDGAREESLEDRSAPARLAMAMAQETPWMGRGAGTFYTTFPQYASADARMYYDHAHNDYAQFLVEVGVIGTSLLAAAVLATLARAVAVISRPRTTTDMGIALGVLMATLAVLLQASVDFHFQIPANALLFVVVLAIPWLLRRQPKPLP